MSTEKPSLDESLTNIQWLCNLESSEILMADRSKKGDEKDQEPTSPNPFTKPPYSYATLIVMAINSTEGKRMTLQDIYKWIETNHPYYQSCKKAWKNSIRHNLSLYDFFIKEKRPSNLPGKGSYWSISAEGKENMMKEVLKHQQPVINSLEYLPGHSRGLRPILPKPSTSPYGSQTSAQVVGEGSMSGLPRGLPVVILPTHLYISMANKLAAQASIGDCSAVGIGAESCGGMQSTTTSTDNSNGKQSLVKSDGGNPSLHPTIPCPRTSNCNSDSLQSVFEEFTVPTVVFPESLKHQVMSSPNLTMSGFDSGMDCSPTFDKTHGSAENTENPAAQKKKKRANFEEPITPKRTKKEQKKKASGEDHQAPLPAGYYIRTTPKRSPLRKCSQTTLASINSSSSIMVSPSNRMKTFSTSLFGNDTSPLQATPTRNPMNRLTDGFLSPSTSAALGCNNYPQTFTPLKFDFDSGIFTPFADGGFDCGFLISPSRYPPVLTPDKWCSTPQSCRKSLRLGVVRDEEQGNDCLGL